MSSQDEEKGELPDSGSSNYSMLSVEEEVDATQPSQLTGMKSNGSVFFDESTRASGEIGLSPSTDKPYYKPYTKQNSEMPSLLASVSEEDIMPAETKPTVSQRDVQVSLPFGKQDSNLPSKDYFSELQQVLPPSRATKRSRSSPQEHGDNLKRLALEWEHKYYKSQDEVKTLKVELKTVKEQNNILKTENKELTERLAIAAQAEHAIRTDEASDNFDGILRAQKRNNKH